MRNNLICCMFCIIPRLSLKIQMTYLHSILSHFFYFNIIMRKKKILIKHAKRSASEESFGGQLKKVVPGTGVTACRHYIYWNSILDGGRWDLSQLLLLSQNYINVPTADKNSTRETKLYKILLHLSDINGSLFYFEIS